ncbi:MAG TPA: radical SAM protein [Elusimicrobiales bacterium]|nr:radical SAM protein [Elusimicrobiales bacterium]
MKQAGVSLLQSSLFSRARQIPLTLYLELSYRCPFNCIHCYCKNPPGMGRELTASDWRKIIAQGKAAGSLWMVLTGGEPLAHPDFEKIYSYAAARGFLISVFTTAYPLTASQLRLFRKKPPYTIEISVYGATAKTYESVTGKRGSFERAMRSIATLKNSGFNISIKMPCMNANFREMGRVKRWAEKNFGSPAEHIYNFSYDTTLYPRLNGDTAPCAFRLSLPQLAQLTSLDKDVQREHECNLNAPMGAKHCGSKKLYRCNAWKTDVFVNPYGIMKFCVFSEKFSRDLRKERLLPSFRKILREVSSAKMKTSSPCAFCHLRDICFSCPAAAALETGHEELPVPYFCALAHETYARWSADEDA